MKTARYAIAATLLAAASCGGLSGTTGTNAPSTCTEVKLNPNVPIAAGSVLYCAGTFGPGQAASLCPDGFVLVSGAMISAISNSCSLNPSLEFFAADVGSWYDPSNPGADNSCTLREGWMVGLRGCGSDQEKPEATSYANTNTCGGWSRALVCDKSAGWKCPDGTLRTASNTNPKQGVVCQKLTR